MDSSATSNFLIGIFSIGSILAIIPVIIFIIWLIFGVGTLTRLTDIKYKLEDIEEAIRANSTTDEDEEGRDSIPTMAQIAEPTIKLESARIAIQAEEPIDTNPAAILNQVVALGVFRKPSKVFIWLLGLVVVVFAVLLLIGFFVI